MSGFLKPLLVVVLYVVIQLMAGIAAGVAMGTLGCSMVGALSVAMLVSSVIMAVLMWWPFGMFADRFRLSGNWRQTLAFVAATLFCIAGTNMMCELAELDDMLSEVSAMMMHSYLGILVVAFVGPIVEEIVFRGAILGHLLRKGVQPWVAVGFSALLFGVIHFNPPQILFASFMGLVLGVIYWQRGNIILTSVLHVFNNSLAVVLSLAAGESEIMISDIVCGRSRVLVLIALAMAGCAYMLWKSLTPEATKELD